MGKFQYKIPRISRGRKEGNVMSHWFSVKTKFTSISAIVEAATELKLPLRYRAICRGYEGKEQKCDMVLNLPGQYDLGFEKQPDGSYKVIADFWSDHISNYLADPATLKSAQEKGDELRKEQMYTEAYALEAEAKMSKFTQSYNRFAVQELAQMQGLQYMESTLEDGTVVLELTGTPY